MKVRRGLSGFDSARGCVLSIGNFDGVHRGHQAMIATLVERGAALGLPSVLLSFEPHPQELLAAQRAPARLTRFREKMVAIGQLPRPPDTVVCLRFDEALSRMPAMDFIERVLVRGFGARLVLVGHDFQFGHGGRGNVALLRQAATDCGYRFECLETVERQGARISSTGIRQALASGDMRQAAQLLGRPYSLCGRVSRGQQLGRELGFPTANIPLLRNRCCLAGVFTVMTEIAGGGRFPGVANVGRRPTVDGLEERLEVHLFDFDADLYGRELKVEFLSRLRAEQRFDGLEALTRQIRLDTEAARRYFDESAEPRIRLQPVCS